jgi:hypothetical protein
VPYHNDKVHGSRLLRGFGNFIQRLRTWQVILPAAVPAILGLVRSPCADGSILYTTVSDFSAWTTNGPTTSLASSTAWDWDGVTTNGVANPNPGTSAGGSLAINYGGSGNYYGPIGDSPDFANLPAAMAAVDPDSTPAYQDPTYLPGVTSAAGGTLLITYTIPLPNVTGTYFQLGADINYDAGGYSNNPLFGSDSYTYYNGYITVTATIPYTIQAGTLQNMNLELWANTDYSTSTPIYVDDIEASATAVPEPASVSLLSISGLALLARRCRRNTSATNSPLLPLRVE